MDIRLLIFSSSLPHARGGVSNVPRLHHVDVWSSPRTWGCFSKELAELLVLTVFPTHVGVFLDWIITQSLNCRLPHARGGVSNNDTESLMGSTSSPRTWGCFQGVEVDVAKTGVFPTHVGF